MHGTRPTARPIAALRRRGGVIGQRLFEAALPALADLALARTPARPLAVPVRASRLSATRRRTQPTI